MGMLLDRIAIDVDPSQYVSAEMAERLLLIAHELVTNATEYGALPNSGGTAYIGDRLTDKGRNRTAMARGRPADSRGAGMKSVRQQPYRRRSQRRREGRTDFCRKRNDFPDTP